MKHLFITFLIAGFTCDVSAFNSIKVSDIPSALTKKCGVPLAEMGNDWNYTCVRKEGIPSSRLVEACFIDGAWQILCDRGGYAVSRNKVSENTEPSANSKRSVIEERVPENAKLVCGPINVAAEEDFSAVMRGHLPKHATLSSTLPAYADGGTVFYQGKGYILEFRKRLTRSGEVDGYMYGPILYFDSSDSFKRVRSGVHFYSREKLDKLMSSKVAEKVSKVPSDYVFYANPVDIESLAKKKMSSKELTVLGVTVGVTDLVQVEKLIGLTYLNHEGETGSSTYGKCYVGADGTVLAFESNEKGGPNHKVLRAMIIRSKDLYRFGDNCISNSKISKRIKFKSGLGLGSSKKQILAKNGKPQKSNDSQLTYSYIFIEKKDKMVSNTNSMIEVLLESEAVKGVSVSEVVEKSEVKD